MQELDKVDLGSIKIHKKVLAEIAYTALQDVEGVKPALGDVIGRVKDLFGVKAYPGVNVMLDKSGQVTIEIQIRVEYGRRLSDAARLTQDAVRTAIERTVDINLKDVNVNIQGIERGRK